MPGLRQVLDKMIRLRQQLKTEYYEKEIPRSIEVNTDFRYIDTLPPGLGLRLFSLNYSSVSFVRSQTMTDDRVLRLCVKLSYNYTGGA
jgi:hypothetical protein